jgi:hypothetical protein
MCSTVRRTLNSKGRAGTQIQFHKVMAVHILTYGSEIYSITQKNMKQEFKLQK